MVDNRLLRWSSHEETRRQTERAVKAIIALALLGLLLALLLIGGALMLLVLWIMGAV